MISRIVLLIAFCYAANTLPAQDRAKITIVSAVDKGDYFYIPRSALADTVRGIVCQSKDKKTNPDKRSIQFYWVSTCNDGYYDLTITPEQIYFSSSHDNPNPNFLFWVTDIDSSQYRQIRKGLQQNLPSGFKDLSKNYGQSLTVFYDDKFKDTFSLPAEWTDSIMLQHDVYCQVQIRRQIERYFSMLNSYINDTAKKLVIPSANMEPKYFSYSRNEIYRWLPVRFEAPKP
jgi:hypothetical protein